MRRPVICICAVAVILLGIASRKFPLGFELWDKYLGDALYAILLYLCITFLVPKKSILWRGVVSMIAVATIETFQLTGIPSQLYQSGNAILRFLAIALGTHFSWLDMIAYAIGIAAIMAIESRARR